MGRPPTSPTCPSRTSSATDTFGYLVSDGNGGEVEGTISIGVFPVPGHTGRGAQTLSTPEDTAVNITLSGTDGDGDTLTYRIERAALHGTLTGIAPSITYTPFTDYSGPDVFEFSVRDPSGRSSRATVSIAVVEAVQIATNLVAQPAVIEITPLRVLKGFDARLTTSRHAGAARRPADRFLRRHDETLLVADGRERHGEVQPGAGAGGDRVELRGALRRQRRLRAEHGASPDHARCRDGARHGSQGAQGGDRRTTGGAQCATPSEIGRDLESPALGGAVDVGGPRRERADADRTPGSRSRARRSRTRRRCSRTPRRATTPDVTSRLTLLVRHDLGQSVTGLALDTDYNGTDNTSSIGAIAVTAQKPAGNFNYSRVSVHHGPTEAGGFSCPVFGTRVRVVTVPIRVRAVTADGQRTGVCVPERDVHRRRAVHGDSGLPGRREPVAERIVDHAGLSVDLHLQW